MKRRKDERWPFDDDWFTRDLFSQFEEEIRNMRRYMEDLFSRFRDGDMEGPFIYGFSMRVGPDGRPQIQEFGNVPRDRMLVESGYREPLTDVLDTGGEIIVTMELPGVRKEDIELDADENSMRVHVETERRKYHKDVEFPEPVNPDKARATFNNGVLEITFPKKRARRGKKIKIQ